MIRSKLYLFLAAICAMLAVSCSGDSDRQVLKHIPHDTDFVCVFDFEETLNSAGGSMEEGRIRLPRYIDDMQSDNDRREFNEINDLLASLGLNLNDLAWVYDYHADDPVYVNTLDDPGKFVAALENNGFKEIDKRGKTTYYSLLSYSSDYDHDYDCYTYVAVKGSVIYCVQDVWQERSAKVLAWLDDFIARAERKSFAEMDYGKYIAEGNAGGVAMKYPPSLVREAREMGLSPDLVKAFDGYVCLKADLADDKAIMSMKQYYSDGKQKKADDFGRYCDLSAKIDTAALRYITAGEQFVMAVSLKNVDYDAIFDTMMQGSDLSRSERGQLSIVKGYLQRLDGTMALGVGVKNGMESIFDLEYNYDILDQISFTLVVEAADGKAKGLIDELKGFLDVSGLPYNDLPDGLSITEIAQGGVINIKYEGNFMIMANHAIDSAERNAAVDEVDFKDYIMAAGLVVKRDDKLFRDLGISDDLEARLTYDAKSSEARLEVELDGGTGGFVDRLLHCVIDVVNNERHLNNLERQAYEKWNSNYGSLYEYGDYELYGDHQDEVFYDPDMH